MGEAPDLPESVRNLPAEEYGRALARFRVATVEVAVIRPDGQLLLMKRKQDPGRGQWWVCGTKLISAESLFQGASRLLQDELNLNIDQERITDLNLSQFIDWPPSQTTPFGEHDQHNIALIKITPKEAEKIQLREHEHSDFQWIPPSEIVQNKENFLEPLVDLCQHL